VAKESPIHSVVVGIVVPAYNAAPHLPKLLTSIVLATSYQFECIVVNDGSTDNTVDVFMDEVGNDSRFQIVSVRNSGVASARNTGYEYLSDDVSHVTFMDADDAYLPGGIDSLLNYLWSKPACKAVHGLGTFEFDEYGIDDKRQYETFGLERVAHRWGIPFKLDAHDDTTLASIILKSTMFPPGLVLLERSLINEIGLFATYPFIHHADDWHYMIRLAMAGPVAFLPQSVLLYRRHESNAGAASTIPIACSNVWRLIYWNPTNSNSQRIQLFFAWKAKQVIDIQQRAAVFVNQKDSRSLRKLLMGLLACTFRWMLGAPSKKMEQLSH
jgi:glycosyltransferase involved in cell wall biosynthesis